MSGADDNTTHTQGGPSVCSQADVVTHLFELVLKDCLNFFLADTSKVQANGRLQSFVCRQRNPYRVELHLDLRFVAQLLFLDHTEEVLYR